MLILLFTFHSFDVISQQEYTITGEILCIESGQAIAFANVALFDTALVHIVSGAASNEAGKFSMSGIVPGTYCLQVSALGFENLRKEVKLINEHLPLGTISLSEKNLELKTVDVLSRRIPARKASDKTTFFVSPKMQETSNTGTDILRLLPGVSVDLQQNISLEGSRNIIILVDGKERDGSYLSQLPASEIDKVEVSSSPSSRYDAGVAGIINVVLTGKKKSGWNGQFYAEIPASGDETFLTPAYNLNCNLGKINLFTSWNGDFRRFSIREIYRREVFGPSELQTITSTQLLTQKTWSHKFHYEMDWQIDTKNQLNFYGNYNPYSQELDGISVVQTTGIKPGSWEASRNDDDKNQSLFNSLWYRHIFSKEPNHELILEASLHQLNALNQTTFTNEAAGIFSRNTLQPDNRSIHLKADYTLPAGEFIRLSSGFQARLRNLNDRNAESFNYNENLFGIYTNFNSSRPKLETTIGLRMEYAANQLFSQSSSHHWHLLPNLIIKYSFSNNQNLILSYRRSLTYPGFYQLNSTVSATDPYTRSSGNDRLQPEIINQVYIEYSNRFKNSFLSTRLFISHAADAIRNLMQFDREAIFYIRPDNLGELYQAGIQVSGTIGFAKSGINPYMKLYDAYSIPGEKAKECQVKSKHLQVLEAGLSAYTTLPWGLTASASLQFTSPVNNMQEESFSDALYFISIEKSLFRNLKAGVVSGIPFAKSFTYQGNDITNNTFSHYSTGNLHLSNVPLWIKISYRINPNAESRNIKGNRQAPEREIRKGF